MISGPKIVFADDASRTLYSGYVEIAPIALADLKLALEKSGCYKGNGKVAGCVYVDIPAEQMPAFFSKEDAVEIYPHGYGFGPMSIYVTKEKVFAVKDIPGSPQIEKFQHAVREDLKVSSGFVKIKESSWKLISTKYPWNVLY